MSYLAEESLDPVVLRNVFLQATRRLYAEPENYGSLRERLKNFRYHAEVAQSTLPVELDFEYNPVTLQPRHSVYVGVGAVGFSTTVLDHRADVSDDRAKITYTQSAATVLRLRFVAPAPDEALYLAVVASAYFMAMSRLFVQRLGLSRFDLNELGEPRLLEKAPTRLFEVPFTANLAFNFNVVSTLEGQRLKTYQLNTLPLTV